MLDRRARSARALDGAPSREAERESARAGRRGPGASEARRARSARALDGPPGTRWAEAERESARAGRRGLGASEERSARRARAPHGPPVTLDYIRRNGVLLTVALCLVVGAALVVRSSRTAGRADPLGHAFLELMAPLERTASAIGRGVSGGWQGVADLVHARGENAALRE